MQIDQIEGPSLPAQHVFEAGIIGAAAGRDPLRLGEPRQGGGIAHVVRRGETHLVAEHAQRPDMRQDREGTGIPRITRNVPVYDQRAQMRLLEQFRPVLRLPAPAAAEQAMGFALGMPAMPLGAAGEQLVGLLRQEGQGPVLAGTRGEAREDAGDILLDRRIEPGCGGQGHRRARQLGAVGLALYPDLLGFQRRQGVGDRQLEGMAAIADPRCCEVAAKPVGEHPKDHLIVELDDEPDAALGIRAVLRPADDPRAVAGVEIPAQSAERQRSCRRLLRRFLVEVGLQHARRAGQEAPIGRVAHLDLVPHPGGKTARHDQFEGMAPVADPGLIEIAPIALGDHPADLRAVGEDHEADRCVGRGRIERPAFDAVLVHQFEIAAKHRGQRRPVSAHTPRAT